MLVWGYAKLDVVPGSGLLRSCMRRFEAQLPLYNHQAIANVFYSLARLKQCSPGLSSALELQATERMQEFNAQVSTLLPGRSPYIWECASVTSMRQMTAILTVSIMQYAEVESFAGAHEHTVGLCQVPLCATQVPCWTLHTPGARGRGAVPAPVGLGCSGVGFRIAWCAPSRPRHRQHQ